MADVGRAVHTHLQATAAVTAISGARGYPELAPQDATFPLYVYTTIATGEKYHLGGLSGVAISRVQVDVYAATHLTAASLAEQIRLALTATRPITAASVTFDRVFREDSQSGVETSVNGSDQTLHRVRQDFSIFHNESVS